MKIHIGEKIKARAKELKLGTTELGKLINTSKQNIYGIFKRSSIDVDVLYEISRALKFNFFQYYEIPELNKKEGKLQKELEELHKEIARLNSEIESLTEKNELLKKINSLLDKKSGKK